MDRHFDDQGFNASGLKTRPSELFQRNCWISFEPGTCEIEPAQRAPQGTPRENLAAQRLPRRAFANQIANDHQPGGDPDAGLELDGSDIEATDSVDDTQPRPDRPLGVVLMRPRIAEIDQDTVAHVFRDKAIKPGDHFGDGAVIRGDDLAQILGIEARRERGRADQVAERYRQLPALGLGGSRSIRG
jgi:hypothetical protein